MAPPGARARPIRPWRVALGMSIGLVGHVPTAWLTLFLLRDLLGSFLEGGSFLLLLLPVIQLPHAVVCMVTGPLLVRYSDRGIGAGLIAGWVVGVLGTAVAGLLIATQWWSTCC
jgi:hypothetical protein